MEVRVRGGGLFGGGGDGLVLDGEFHMFEGLVVL